MHELDLLSAQGIEDSLLLEQMGESLAS